MQILHEMLLPQAAWDEFIVRLTHYNKEHQMRINAFLDDISNTLDISHEPDRTVVSSNDIDELAILAALEENICDDENERSSEIYAIQFYDFFEVYDSTPFTSQFATEDMYSKRLLTYTVNTLEYKSTDIIEFQPAA